MVFTSDSFFDWIFDIVKGINFFDGGTNYIAVLGIVLVSAILISPRKLSNIKVLALPLMVGYSIIGLNIPLLFLVLAGVVFVMETLSTKGIGDMIEAVGQAGSNIIQFPERRKEKVTSNFEKRISMAGRETAIREAEKSKLIPFRRGTKISDILEIEEKKKIERAVRSKSRSPTNQKELDRMIQRLKLLKEKEKYFEVDE